MKGVNELRMNDVYNPYKISLCLKCENKNVDKIQELYIILNMKKIAIH
jgi:hypothetical protein